MLIIFFHFLIVFLIEIIFLYCSNERMDIEEIQRTHSSFIGKVSSKPKQFGSISTIYTPLLISATLLGWKGQS